MRLGEVNQVARMSLPRSHAEPVEEARRRAELLLAVRPAIVADMWLSAALILVLSVLVGLPCRTGIAKDDGVSPPPLTQATNAALDLLRQQPTWLFPADACPADVAPVIPVHADYSLAVCQADLEACLSRCETGDGSACFAVALSVQALNTDFVIAEALFLRACRLGIAAGCTNRAAGMTYLGPSTPAVNACAARTFRMSCEQGDPWGCTMYGYHLMGGRGVSKDLDLAARMFERACAYDEPFIACTRAKALLQEIANERRRPPDRE